MTQDTLTAPGRHSDASSPAWPTLPDGGFGGYSEDAPLDLSGLSDAAFASLAERLIDRTFDAFAETAAAVRYCAHPVRLTGGTRTFEVNRETGEVGNLVSSFWAADAPLGVLYRACGNRRADVCPSCSRTYARDTFEMIRAGLVGGKTVPVEVAENPLLFVTFTAPSFGLVHSAHKDGSRCRPRGRDKGKRCEHGRPVSCMSVHDPEDPVTGSAFCVDCYDWSSAVVWQWWSSSELFRRTMQDVRRALAKRLGKAASLQYAKVAEYQARGLIHFHALVRLDGDDGPGSPAPLDAHELADIVETATRAVSFDAPPVDATDVTRRLVWGQQLDIRIVRDRDRTDNPEGPLAPEQVAGYLAKYATKDANSIRVDAPRPHLARLTAECQDLDGAAAAYYGYARKPNGKPINPYALLGKWTHMLGFPGHFSSKSRRYSITLGRLRRARAKYQALVAKAKDDADARAALLDLEHLEARLLADDADDETTLVVNDWTYQGTGWTTAGDEALALAAAARAREYDQWKAQTRKTKDSGR